MKILLLHGWGHSKEVWEPILESLEGENEVNAIDLPGFGEEPLISESWDIPDYARWIADNVDLSNTILLGHSFGGRIAAYIASQQPNLLKGLILSGTPGLYRPSVYTKLLILRYKLLKSIFPKKLLKGVRTDEDSKARDENMGIIWNNAVKFDQTENLPKISIPTLILTGENDTDAPVAISKEMHNLIPNSELQILPNLGHNIFIENKELFYGKIQSFLKTL